MILVTRDNYTDLYLTARSFSLSFALSRISLSRKIEIEELAKHGVMLPPDIMGLTDEQVEELKLKDEWADKCVPMGGWTFNGDKIGT